MTGHSSTSTHPLLDLQRLFDGVLVELVDDGVGRITVESVVGRVELLLGPRVGNLLDAHDDLHATNAPPDATRGSRRWVGPPVRC